MVTFEAVSALLELENRAGSVLKEEFIYFQSFKKGYLSLGL